MIRLDLSRLFAAQARQGKRSMLSRLRRGVDARFRALPGKREDDGKPLGGDGVPRAIEAAQERVHPDGFELVASELVAFFSSGRKRGKAPKPKPVIGPNGRRRRPRKKDRPADTRAQVQPPRPVFAFSAAERRTWRQEAATEAARQITAQLDSSAPFSLGALGL